MDSLTFYPIAFTTRIVIFYTVHEGGCWGLSAADRYIHNCYCLLTEEDNKYCVLTDKVLVSTDRFFPPLNMSFIFIFNENKYFQTHHAHGLQKMWNLLKQIWLEITDGCNMYCLLMEGQHFYCLLLNKKTRKSPITTLIHAWYKVRNKVRNLTLTGL